jgi:hypothetical protein
MTPSADGSRSFSERAAKAERDIGIWSAGEATVQGRPGSQWMSEIARQSQPGADSQRLRTWKTGARGRKGQEWNKEWAAGRVRLGCSCLSRATRAGAWLGSASALAACRAADPWPSLPSFLAGCASLISSDRTHPTIANMLNSSRPTGSLGSCIEPPRLSFTFRLVSSSKMSRASGSEGGEPVQLGNYQGVTGSAGSQC